MVEKLFLRAPARRKSKAEELAILRRARRFTASSDGARLSAWSWGTGPAVLLVHGWGGNAGQLAPFVEPLVEAGFTAIAFDGPAHGLSSGDEPSIPRVARAIETIARKIGPLFGVIAHSMGAAATSFAVARGLPLERAVMIGSPSDAALWFESFSRHFGLSDPVRHLARARIEDRVGVPFAEINAAVLGPQVRAPILVIHDRQDREVSWDEGAIVARTTPRARLLSTEGLGHRRILRDPSVIRDSIAFLSEARPAPRPLQQEIDRDLFNRELRWA